MTARAPACRRCASCPPSGAACSRRCEAAVDARDDAAARVVDAAHRVDELGEVVEVDLDQVVDVDAEVLLDRLDGERGAADRVGGVDLVAAVAGMSTTVSRGIESLRAVPPPTRISMIESERLGPDVLRAGLLGALRALVGAEHEDRVAARAAGSRRRRAARPAPLGDLVLLDLRADQEEHEREAEPADERHRRAT